MENNEIEDIRMEGRGLVLHLALQALKDAEECYNATKQFTPEIWTQLHSFFGDILIEALELLEDRSLRLIKYQTQDKLREIYKIHLRKYESFTIYKDINFCQCQQFRQDLLKSKKIIMCKHCLLVKLNEIYPQITVRLETISGSQFVDFLNEQIHQIDDIINDENKS